MNTENVIRKHRAGRFRIEERLEGGRKVVYVNGVETVGSFSDAITKSRQAPYRKMLGEVRDMLAEIKRIKERADDLDDHDCREIEHDDY